MEPKPSRLFARLPLFLSLALACFALLPQVQGNRILLYTFLITAGLLSAWAAALIGVMAERGAQPLFSVSLLKQHYLQACAHLSILIYWGWYWRPLYEHAYLIAAQLVFAYAFDMLLQLSRRSRYVLGFGPFPIIFSTNLFLLFHDDFFYLQFLLIAVGFAAKELLHWMKGGRSAHIFNPSSFPLAITSWILLLSHSLPTTWGEQIAGTQFAPPQIFLFIFLVSLPGQFFFGVTTMTLPAVLTMYLWGLVHYLVTGTYVLETSYIPIAVFLAMNLLVTDPSTSPRTELGRVLYGISYGATVMILELLTHRSFTSKLLVVPLLNLGVQWIDRLAQSPALRSIDPARLAPWIAGRKRNLAFIGIWVVVFGLLSAVQGVGDDHPGQSIPFWQEACAMHRHGACHQLARAEDLACNLGSPWACNESAIAIKDHDAKGTLEHLRRACVLGFEPACDNLQRFGHGHAELLRAPPDASEYPILLSIYKPVRRKQLENVARPELYADACRHGWADACGEPGSVSSSATPRAAESLLANAGSGSCSPDLSGDPQRERWVGSAARSPGSE